MAGLWNDITGIVSEVVTHIPGFAPREIEKIVIREVETITMSHTRTFVRVAGLSGALSVALAAYGSHGFNQSDSDPRLKTTFDIANRIHMMHTIALLASPLARRPYLVGTLLTSGMILFSGSCYYHALTGNNNIRFITPYGGILLIFGWLAMIL